jgi:hypothetical protein
MIGDQNDILSKLLQLLPYGWFADDSPILITILTGAANALSFSYEQAADLKRQTRIQKDDDLGIGATGIYLDYYARSYFGNDLLRCENESDDAYRARILGWLLRPKGTRQSMLDMVEFVTGNVPVIFEDSYDGFFLDHSFVDHGSLGGIGGNYTFVITVTMPEENSDPTGPFYVDETLFLDNGYAIAPFDGSCLTREDVARYIGANEVYPALTNPNLSPTVLENKPIGTYGILYFTT